LINLKNDVKKLTSLHWDIKNSWNKVAWTVGGIFAFLGIIQLFTGKGILDLIR
jgi:hypothetical protein